MGLTAGLGGDDVGPGTPTPATSHAGHVLLPEITEPRHEEWREQIADLHLVEPSRLLRLARAGDLEGPVAELRLLDPDAAAQHEVDGGRAPLGVDA